MHLRTVPRFARCLALATAFGLLISACGGSATSAGPGSASSTTSAPSAAGGGGGGGGGGGTTAFALSGGVTGQLTVSSSDCRKGSGQDQPTQFTFTGTLGGLTYSVSIGGFALVTGTYDLTAAGGPGVSVESNPSGSGSDPSIFWAAPLRQTNPGASGSMSATVSDSGGSGQLDAKLVQEALGLPTAGGSIVHLSGSWSCQFSS